MEKKEDMFNKFSVLELLENYEFNEEFASLKKINPEIFELFIKSLKKYAETETITREQFDKIFENTEDYIKLKAKDKVQQQFKDILSQIKNVEESPNIKKLVDGKKDEWIEKRNQKFENIEKIMNSISFLVKEVCESSISNVSNCYSQMEYIWYKERNSINSYGIYNITYLGGAKKTEGFDLNDEYNKNNDNKTHSLKLINSRLNFEYYYSTPYRIWNCDNMNPVQNRLICDNISIAINSKVIAIDFGSGKELIFSIDGQVRLYEIDGGKEKFFQDKSDVEGGYDRIIKIISKKEENKKFKKEQSDKLILYYTDYTEEFASMENADIISIFSKILELVNFDEKRKEDTLQIFNYLLSKANLKNITHCVDDRDKKIKELEEQVAQILQENSNLQSENSNLQNENAFLQDINTVLQSENTSLQNTNTALKNENNEKDEMIKKSQNMLRETMEVMEKIDHNPIGHTLFKNYVKELRTNNSIDEK